MTDRHPSAHYTPQQALARDVLTLAINGATTRWARVHGYTVNCPPEQVRAEGIDITDRSLWAVDLSDIEQAITKLTEQPERFIPYRRGVDANRVASAVATVRNAQNKLAAGISPTAGLPFYFDLMPRMDIAADIVFQVAVADEVIY